MIDLQSKNLLALRTALNSGYLSEVLPKVVGGYSLANGFWRLFSEKYPEPGGAVRWNSSELWRITWVDLSPDLFFFGEDIFGNQLTMRHGTENVFLWNHENGQLIDLLLDPATLLETAMQSGVSWIDFYTEQMLTVGSARLLDVPESCHLHWTQPLILAGAATIENTSILEAIPHLRFHGELWLKLHDLPPGTEVAIKPKK